MASPLGHHRVMAIDPGFRTGCKIVCLDENGKFLDAKTEGLFLMSSFSANLPLQNLKNTKKKCEEIL